MRLAHSWKANENNDDPLWRDFSIGVSRADARRRNVYARNSLIAKKQMTIITLKRESGSPDAYQNVMNFSTCEVDTCSTCTEAAC